MRKRLVFIGLIFLISCKKSSDQLVSDRYVLSISIENVTDGTKLYLRKQEDNLSIDLDTTFVINGEASFEGSIGAPEVYGIFIDGQTTGIFPIVEKGEVFITADVKALEQTRIQGTFLNDQLAQYKNRVAQILSKTNTHYHDFQKARAENDLNTLNQINERIAAIQKEKVAYAQSFVEQHPNSFVSTMVLHSMVINRELENQQLFALYDRLSDEVKKTEFSKAIVIELQLDSLRRTPSTP